MNKTSLATFTGMAALALGLSGPVQAAGFYIQEQSVSGTGTAFAGQVAMPRDASILYYNPAGLTHLDDAQVNAGIHMIDGLGEMEDTGSTTSGAITIVSGQPSSINDGGNPFPPGYVPNFYAATPLMNGDLWAGIGVSVPFGLATVYDEGFFGRYDSKKSSLRTMDIQPTLAYQVSDKVSIGGSVIVQYARADLDNKALFPLGGGNFDEVDSELTGDDWAYGVNLGIMYEPWDDTLIGLNYRSQTNQELEGSLTFVGPTLGVVTTAGAADVDLPEIASIGASHKLNDRWTIMGHASWFGWGAFDAIDATTANPALTPGAILQNYQDSWAFAIGADYTLNEAWTLRGGFQYEETPVTDEFRTTIVPDGDRLRFGAGFTYNMNDKMSLDVGGNYIETKDESLNITRNEGLSTVSADYEGAGGVILSAGFNYKF